MNTIKLKVDGMECGGCENRIKNSLELLDGVEEVTCSYIKKEVIILADKEMDTNIIKEEIENLGFEVKED